VLRDGAADSGMARRGRAIAARDIFLDDGLEFGGDAVALERDRTLAIDEDRRRRHLAGAGQADADVGMAALARTVDHATHYCHVHGLDARILLAPYGHL